METRIPVEKRLSAGAAIGTWALLFGATLIAYLPALQGGLLWDGRLPDAIGEYEAALRANPAYAEAHYNLGLALAKAGRAPEAIAELEAVLRMDPDSARTHYNLGVLLWRIGGRKPEALAHFDAALRLRPDPELRRLADRLRAAQP